MAVTSSKKTTDLNKLASVDALEATTTDDAPAVEKATKDVAPVADVSAADAPVVVDPINIALSVIPAQHGLPAFPL
jgi:hypothetical protein